MIVAHPSFAVRASRLVVQFALLAFAVAVSGSAALADVTKPAAVAGLLASRSGGEVRLAWTAVTNDAAGRPETVDHYNVYRAVAPGFTPDTTGHSNRIGTSVTSLYDDLDAVADGAPYFYLVTAVDSAGNESAARPSAAATPPVLSGSWTDTSVELAWTPAQPAPAVAAYRVYCGNAPRTYSVVADAGLLTTFSLQGVQTLVNWYCAVVAVDADGNESAFSNEHVDAIAGRVRLRAQDDDYLCWIGGGASCPPRPGTVQRNDGWQLLVPVDFPEGSWKRVTVSYTLDSRLCSPPTAPDRCGNSNPGGWNPCGDPWDRIAQLFLVLDNCIEAGGSCITHQNLELMRAVTPFGTDALPPEGRGIVPPRVLTLDITPFAPLLVGHKYVGAEIVNFVQAGWHVTVDFNFSERPDEASPKPPASGIQIAGFGTAPFPPKQITIPASARQVKMRVFTTGHGGALYCDGGTNAGAVCAADSDCPGGECNPCDEFCHKENQVLRNGTTVLQFAPYRTDCSPADNPCFNWNSCGYPSCIFPRAGWCPGTIACHKDAPCDQDFNVRLLFPAGGTYDFGYQVAGATGYWPVSVVFYWYN